jgi:hypothetical protein
LSSFANVRLAVGDAKHDCPEDGRVEGDEVLPTKTDELIHPTERGEANILVLGLGQTNLDRESVRDRDRQTERGTEKERDGERDRERVCVKRLTTTVTRGP